MYDLERFLQTNTRHLLAEYEQRTAWKYERVQGNFHTPDSLKSKIADDGQFLDFKGNTVVFKLDDAGTRIIQSMQQELRYWLKGTEMLAAELPADTTHMTLHDLICPEHCRSDNEADYNRELDRSRQRAVEITEKIRQDYAGQKITMVADRIVNMVSKSIVLLLRPQTEQDYVLLQNLYDRYDAVTTFPFPYTPHITLAYYKPGMLDGEKLQKAFTNAQIHPELAPAFEFHPEEITVQTFYSMKDYRDVSGVGFGDL